MSLQNLCRITDKCNEDDKFMRCGSYINNTNSCTTYNKCAALCAGGDKKYNCGAYFFRVIEYEVFEII